MHVVIIIGATRHQSKSNTAKIIDAFCVGLSNSGNTSEICKAAFMDFSAQTAPEKIGLLLTWDMVQKVKRMEV